jgi:hypothetical protein
MDGAKLACKDHCREEWQLDVPEPGGESCQRPYNINEVAFLCNEIVQDYGSVPHLL